MRALLLVFVICSYTQAKECFDFTHKLPSEFDISEIVTARAGGEHVGNGGGLAESNFAFSKEHLKRTIFNCLQSTNCLTDKKQRAIAKRVYNAIHPSTELRYVSEKNNPGFFFLDDNIRVAQTGLKPRSPIYINRDLIYDRLGRALGLSQTTAILFHEFGHHAKIHDHDILDHIGAKVGNFAGQRVVTLANYFDKVTLPNTKKKILEAKTLQTTDSFEDLIVTDRSKTFELNKVILPKILKSIKKTCLKNAEFCLNILGIEDTFKVPEVLYYQNVELEKRISPELSKSLYIIEMSADFYFHPEAKIGSSQFYHIKGKAKFKFIVDRLESSIRSLEIKKFSVDPYFGIHVK